MPPGRSFAHSCIGRFPLKVSASDKVSTDRSRGEKIRLSDVVELGLVVSWFWSESVYSAFGKPISATALLISLGRLARRSWELPRQEVKNKTDHLVGSKFAMGHEPDRKRNGSEVGQDFFNPGFALA